MRPRQWFPVSMLFILSLATLQISTAAPAQAAACPHYLIGLHGMGQGPDDTWTYPNSPEVQSTWEAFQARARQLHASNYGFQNLLYPTAPMVVYGDAKGLHNVVRDVYKGEAALEDAIRYSVSICHSTTFTLVGYSEGAWVINYWLNDHRDEWSIIKGVELYGDPDWYWVYSTTPHKKAYFGLARLFFLSPPGDYPISGTERWLQSLCIVKDPVCGQGYPESAPSHTQQAHDALHCDSCNHKKYVGAATKQGGEFLANRAFG